jgi:glycosyltransferase involved in cell wall biosynthesis
MAIVAPIRIVQVVARMHRGGVETWLMQVVRHLDRARFQMDFVVTQPGPADYDEEIRALGSSIWPCPLRPDLTRFARELRTVLSVKGPYGVVHSHLHHFSGFVLGLARHAGVPVRLAHSHLDSASEDASAGIARRAYLGLMKAALRRYATGGLSVSAAAATALFGEEWRADERWRIARCGLDFKAFRDCADVGTLRAELGLAPDAIVLGHVGRFDPQKNHAYLLRIAETAFAREPRARLVLVGSGPLRAGIEEEAGRLGIRDRVVFAGVRADVARLLRAFDVFVLPSLREGLPLVGLEAQAAGLPIVLSEEVTREVVVLPELFTWRSIAASPAEWADAALRAARQRVPLRVAVEALDRSEFSLARALPALLDVYAGPQRDSPRRPVITACSGS